MAGMGDNPLVGDYTKGISKGREYFVALMHRINAEKANPKVVAADLQMGLFQARNPLLASHVKRNGLGRFGPVSAPKSVVSGETNVVKKAVGKRTKAVDNMSINQLRKSCSQEKLLLLQKHFCG